VATVELKTVSKAFGGAEAGRKLALNAVSMTIRDGETVAVVGPSGCGKSTLLKVIAGLEYPDSGQVLYDGVDYTEVKPQERGVGMVFQDYALYPSKKGEGNLKYYFEVHQRSEDEKVRKIKETAEIMGVGFELLLGRIPTTLSGGEQQRVAIARCIVRDPRLFLMDEPICNLDAKLRERTRIEMKKLLRRFNITTLYVTHDQQEAVFMGDRIAVMRAGVLEQFGSYDDLYYSPVNSFVAQFIGAPPMSLLPISPSANALRLPTGADWPLPPQLRQLSAPAAQLGVRPEGWRLSSEAGLPFELLSIEQVPTERASYLRGRVAGHPVTVLAPVGFTQQRSLYLTPDWEQAYLFGEDGATLHHPAPVELF
jgi:ABC-type sugar transport system ATPase subunit